MPQPDDSGQESRLQDGYRLLAEMILLIVAGIGIGWVVDDLAHATPAGVVVGLLVGAAIAMWRNSDRRRPARARRREG